MKADWKCASIRDGELWEVIGGQTTILTLYAVTLDSGTQV